MKKSAYSNEEILILLASKGDAAAFYSITAPYFEIEYLNLRHNGIPHNDALEKILPDSSELFRKIIGANPVSFSEWFKENSEISSDQSDEVALFSSEKNLSSELESFFKSLQLHLLRTASEFNKKTSKKFLLTLIHHPQAKLILSIFTLVFIFVFLTILLYITGSSVSFGLHTSNKNYNFNLGPVPQKNVTDTIVVETALKSDTLHADTLKDSLTPAKIEEKTPEPPPVKRVVRPRPVPVDVNRVQQHQPAAQRTDNLPVTTEEQSESAPAVPSAQPAVQQAPETSLPEQNLE